MDKQNVERLSDLSSLQVGDQVRFHPQPGRTWWRIVDRNEKYIAAIRQAPFQPKGKLQYTVVAHRDYQYNGVGPGVIRTSLNTLGGGWDIEPDGTGAETIIPALESGEWELSLRRLEKVWSYEVRA